MKVELREGQGIAFPRGTLFVRNGVIHVESTIGQYTLRPKFDVVNVNYVTVTGGRLTTGFDSPFAVIRHGAHADVSSSLTGLKSLRQEQFGKVL